MSASWTMRCVSRATSPTLENMARFTFLPPQDWTRIIHSKSTPLFWKNSIDEDPFLAQGSYRRWSILVTEWSGTFTASVHLRIGMEVMLIFSCESLSFIGIFVAIQAFDADITSSYSPIVPSSVVTKVLEKYYNLK